MRDMMRRQLPAYTPQSPASAVASFSDAMLSSERSLAELRDYLARRFAASDVLLTSSGTQALQVALQLATEADEGRRPVALPAYGCYDLITAAVGARARIVFYDVEPADLQPDRESLGAALAVGVCAVVATPLYGFPLDWTWLRERCAESGALLIEDSAQGLGSEWRGVEGGSFGDATVLSFGRGKGWSGAGGGALLVRHEGLRRAVQAIRPPAPPLGTSLRAFIGSAALWALGRPRLYTLPSSLPFLHLGVTTYKEPGPVIGPSPFAVASALRQADVALEAVEGRRRWAAAWHRSLKTNPLGAAVRPCRVPPGGASGYLRFPLVTTEGSVADALLEGGRSAGVGPPYPRALHELDAARRLTVKDAATPGADHLARSLVTLPTHSRTEQRDVEGVRAVLRELAAARRLLGG
jgi:dTDP-4-amino-4,6-dideoxygalactose transaminase